MDTLASYRHCVQELLEQLVAQGPMKEGVESQILMDTVRDHYQWMRVGWNDSHRVYHVVMHLDIKEGQVWIQQNMTDSNLTEMLVASGIDREDIILGLQPAYKRDASNVAVA
jgi:hypothetical protein